MRIFLFLALLLIPTAAALAAVENFVPIAPIPSGVGGSLATQGDLSTYFNSLFKLALAAGAGLAAIFIAIGGFEYIFSESMESKKTGRLRIVNALLGLGILLTVTIILYVVGGSKAISLDLFK